MEPLNSAIVMASARIKRRKMKQIASTLLYLSPDTKALLLKGRNMCQTWEEEQIEVFQVLQTRDDTPRKNVVYFVTLVGCEVQDDPDVNLAVRLFVAIELSPVYREHDNYIVVLDFATFYSI